MDEYRVVKYKDDEKDTIIARYYFETEEEASKYAEEQSREETDCYFLVEIIVNTQSIVMYKEGYKYPLS